MKKSASSAAVVSPEGRNSEVAGRRKAGRDKLNEQLKMKNWNCLLLWHEINKKISPKHDIGRIIRIFAAEFRGET